MNTAKSVVCGSLSRHPVSLGAVMHRAGYAALGLDYVYLPFECRDLAGALAGMRALGIRGFGVSMPFKVEILPLLDRIDPMAERIGAVNTVVNDEGTLVGYNTDAGGAVRALRERLEPNGKTICVIGAGGAARAVTFGLVSDGARVHVVNRTAGRAVGLARELSEALGATVSAGDLGELAALEGFDAVVNASSAGMQEYGAESLIADEALRPGLVVMDIVYKPVHTELILAAQRRGALAIPGARMLLHQAARQFELYTGRTPPVDAMNLALNEAL